MQCACQPCKGGKYGKSNICSGGGKTCPKKSNRTHNLRKDLFDKAKLLFICIIFAFVWNTIWYTNPVTAQVTDNASSVIHSLLGEKNAQITGSYEDSVTNAKINYLESQIKALKGDLQTLQAVLDSK